MTRVDFPTFVALWNRLEGRATPAFHLRIARWLEAGWRGGDRRLLLLAFRNSGKSSLIALFIVWALTEAPDLRVLVLAAEQSLAEKLAANARALVRRHPLARHLAAPGGGDWAADRFTVRRSGIARDPSVLARGLTANITGAHADLVVCDDVEVPNTAGTEEARAQLRRRLGELDFVLEPGGGLLYVGTPHAYDSIYGREGPEGGAPFLQGYDRLEIPVLTEAGESQWPDRFPAAAIDAMRRSAGPNRFQSQMLLEPVSPEDGRLDPRLLIPYDAEIAYTEALARPRLSIDGVEMASASAWWDPAYGAAAKGDRSVVAVVFQDRDGGYWLHRAHYLALAGGADDPATAQCREVAGLLAALHLPAVTVEANGVGAFLPALLRKALAEAGVPAAVRPAHSSLPKDQRILAAFDAPLAAGAVRAHRSVLASPFLAEMREWRPGARVRDDGLDAAAGALLAEPVRLGARLPVPRRPADWRPGLAPIQADDRFPV